MAMNNPLSIPLNCSNASRQSRETLRNEVINQQTLFPFLMQFVLDPSSKLNIKACWVLELVLESNPQLIVPFLDSFCLFVQSFQQPNPSRNNPESVIFQNIVSN